MSNYANLKSAIQEVIKTNGRNEITGQLLQTELLAMINTLGYGYQFMGVANPNTVPGTPDAKVFYLAYEAGTYTNFGGIVVAGFCVLKYATGWSKEDIPISGGGSSFTLQEDDLQFAGGQGLKLMFANRINGVNIDSGLDYFILRDDVSFQNQVTVGNTIYEIRYDFDLNGGTHNIPAGCVLRFNGGKVSNGTIVGNGTIISGETDNIFANDIVIDGTWNVGIAESKMFDNSLDGIALFNNLSKLSKSVRLSSKRTYNIVKNDDTLYIDSLFCDDGGKAQINFKNYLNSNLGGIIFYSDNLILYGLKITEDFDSSLFPGNDQTNGSALGVVRVSQTDYSKVRILNCNFSGNTSSSYFASSQTKDIIVDGCQFGGADYSTLADHCVYCSTNIKSFIVRNCFLNKINGASGLFKVRVTCDTINFENIIGNDVSNTYLFTVQLQQQGKTNVSFRNITCFGATGVAPIFCNLQSSDNTIVTFNSIIVENCSFENRPGYNIFNRGTSPVAKGVSVSIKGSNIQNGYIGGGLICDYYSVEDTIADCNVAMPNQVGINVKKRLSFRNVHISVPASSSTRNYLFQVPASYNPIIDFVGCDFDVVATYLIDIAVATGGELRRAYMKDNTFANLTRTIFGTPNDNTPILWFVGEHNVGASVVYSPYLQWANRDKGSTSFRPTPSVVGGGFIYYDTTLKKMILSDGTNWVNMDGTPLS